MQGFLDGFADICADGHVRISLHTKNWCPKDVIVSQYEGHKQFDGEIDEKTWIEE